MATKTKAQLAEIEESREFLRGLLNPKNVRRAMGDNGPTWFVQLEPGAAYPTTEREIRDHLPTLYFVIESVSRSGMSRKMRAYVQATDDNGRPYLRWITNHVAKVLGWRMKRDWKNCIQVDGCGMDMCFHLTDCLLHAVFGYGPDALNANHFRRETL